MEIFFLIAYIGSMVATVLLAKHNGRNAGLSLFWSFFFGWIAFIVYLCMGKSFDKKIEEARSIRQAQGLEL